MGGEDVAVADAGPLIHLDELGAIALLSVFDRVLVPDVVLSEVLRHRPGFSLSPGVTRGIAATDPTALVAHTSMRGTMTTNAQNSGGPPLCEARRRWIRVTPSRPTTTPMAAPGFRVTPKTSPVRPVSRPTAKAAASRMTMILAQDMGGVGVGVVGLAMV